MAERSSPDERDSGDRGGASGRVPAQESRRTAASPTAGPTTVDDNPIREPTAIYLVIEAPAGRDAAPPEAVPPARPQPDEAPPAVAAAPVVSPVDTSPHDAQAGEVSSALASSGGEGVPDAEPAASAGGHVEAPNVDMQIAGTEAVRRLVDAAADHEQDPEFDVPVASTEAVRRLVEATGDDDPAPDLDARAGEDAVAGPLEASRAHRDDREQEPVPSRDELRLGRDEPASIQQEPAPNWYNSERPEAVARRRHAAGRRRGRRKTDEERPDGVDEPIVRLGESAEGAGEPADPRDGVDDERTGTRAGRAGVDKKRGHPAEEWRDTDEEPLPEVAAEIDLQRPPRLPRHGRRRMPKPKAVGATMLMTALLGGAVIVAAAFGGGRGDGSTFGAGGGGGRPGVTQPADGASVSAPLNGRKRANLDLVSGTGAVRLRAADLGDDLYRITVQGDGAQPPRPVIQGDQVRLRLPSAGRSGAVDIQLSSRVRWQFRLSGGTAPQVLDLAGAPLAGLELLGGSARVEVSLPPAVGTFVVRVSGGVNQFLVRVPKGRPVKVRAGGGAGSVVLNGTRHDGVSAGKVFIPSDWDATADRFSLDLVAGVGTLIVEQR